MKKDKKPLGIYLHIPFCHSKCLYCDFYSFHLDDADFMESYISALMLQMEDISDNCRGYVVDTIYIGGGTPTLLPPKLIRRLLDSVRVNFKVDKNAEITIEANPATVNKKSLRAIRRAGVNRLSIGLQSANDDELRALGRIHTAEDFAETFEDARDAGFKNISVDLMYGIPNQSYKSFMNTIKYVAELAPEHISMYNLKIEDGTPFGEMRGSLVLPDEDTEYNMYEDGVKLLASVGYNRYEMSNFSKEGYESRHNLKYWTGADYLGFGAAAHSYFCGERYSIVKNATAFVDGIQVLESGINVIAESRYIDRRESMNEYVMLRMRLEEGVSAKAFERRFGVSFSSAFGKYLDEYVPDGFVTKKGDTYKFSTKGMFVSNYILSAVLDFPEENIGKSF